MRKTDLQIRELIAQRAADWFIANREGLTIEQRQSFTDWLKTSPVHVEEYLAVAVIARDLRRACAEPARSIDTLVASARSEQHSTVAALRPAGVSDDTPVAWRGWQLAAVALSVAVLVVSSLVLLRDSDITRSVGMSPETVATIHYQTGHGQQHAYELADHSVVRLNTDSDLTIRYSQTERAATLNFGEAVFEVNADTARPFRVTAKSAQIVDLGTKFNVRLKNATTVVTVMEGRIEVLPSNAGPNEAGLQVAAGGQVSVTDGVVPTPPVPVDTGRATAWLHRQISFDREPLEHVAAEFNRYSPKSIEITTPALRSLRVSGVFTTDDTAAFIAFLASLDGVQVEESATRIRVFQGT
jgi:transmembrane sensor